MSPQEYELKLHLNKLQKAYDQTKEAMLGSDWETRTELKLVAEQIVEKMRITINRLQALNKVPV